MVFEAAQERQADSRIAEVRRRSEVASASGGIDTDLAELVSAAMSHQRVAEGQSDTEVKRLAHSEVGTADWEEIAGQDIVARRQHHTQAAAERRTLEEAQKMRQAVHMVAGTRGKPDCQVHRQKAVAAVDMEASQLAI